ncbi:hypothetical protein KP79_PYT22196 [Mizuhopecten yessoensis]|uniref:Apple domain-containing protein n=1 Tax=Mizuhopecten yessoensis TaxID=6573 RepID=A0A210PET2_MIZYE|nr:hypothetical protein KP79_PYT22196 [Mizuhopecten yessoensis]
MARVCRCHVFVLIVSAVTLTLLMVSCIASTCNYVNVKQEDVIFNSSWKWKLHTKGLQQCLKECSALTACLSVNFEKTTLECTLNTESATSTSSNTDTAQGMIYLERNQWEQVVTDI